MAQSAGVAAFDVLFGSLLRKRWAWRPRLEPLSPVEMSMIFARRRGGAEIVRAVRGSSSHHRVQKT